MHYYQHHIGDYAQATAHLSMLEDAAYSRMLRWYYAEEKPLPSDAAAVCRIVRATSKQEREAVEIVLSEFFVLQADGYHQRRADAEIAQFTDKQNKARRSAKARWDKEHEQCERNANALPTQCEGNAPINQEPRTKKEKKEPPLSGKPDQMAEVREVLTFLRNMTGRAYREAPPTVNLIKSRLKNTSVDDIKRVLVHKGQQWLDDPEMEQFLRPSTLFRPSNFEQYLAEALANHA